MDAKLVQEYLDSIERYAADDEKAHGLEDELYTNLLTAIAKGKCSDPVKCAKLALTSKRINFGRWTA